MNVYEIETLVRSADQLRNYSVGTNGDKVHDLLLERVIAELGKVETAEEVRALQVSNDIKQANLNLLAGKVLGFVNSGEGNLKDLEELAKNLIQEDPETSAVS